MGDVGAVCCGFSDSGPQMLGKPPGTISPECLSRDFPLRRRETRVVVIPEDSRFAILKHGKMAIHNSQAKRIVICGIDPTPVLL